MRLTRYTDYSLRALIYLGTKGNHLATVPEIAARYAISENHLTKIIGELAKLGHVRTVRGRNGGFALARPPAEINVGSLVRALEDSLDIVECFQAAGNTCPIAGCCKLRGALGRALGAFLAVLDEYSLADLLTPAPQLAWALGLEDAGGRSAG